jgi:hypothetical protein
MIDDFRPVKPKKPARIQKPTVAKAKTDEPVFRTPEEIAATEEPQPLVPPTILAATANRFGWTHSRRNWALVAVVALLLVGVGVWFKVHHDTKSLPVTTTKTTTPKKISQPATIYSSLTGLPVSLEASQRPVTGIMIENSKDARPQSGLSQAGVVFEAIAEGGITRFLALYQDEEPSNIGPVRSVRPYYLQWLLGFDAPIAHVGGSPEALKDIRSWNVKDLDQFANAGAYTRVKSRPAPHNVYTSIAKLRALETKKGFTTSNFTGFARKKDSASQTPSASSIDFAISSRLYNVHYDYDAASNSYKRSEGGSPHTDANGGAQIKPKVVIALVIPYNLQADNKHSNYGLIGSGQAYIFQDGSVTIGKWSKASDTAQITFSDAGGQPLPLNAGQTWISAVGASNKVSYK